MVCISEFPCFTLFSCFLVDLDEIWRALGVSGCPQCVCRDDHLADYDADVQQRTFASTISIIRTTRELLLERGNVTTVNALLRDYRLSVLHTKTWNPFLMLPHVDYDCFPQDHLHGVYVDVFFFAMMFHHPKFDFSHTLCLASDQEDSLTIITTGIWGLLPLLWTPSELGSRLPIPLRQWHTGDCSN